MQTDLLKRYEQVCALIDKYDLDYCLDAICQKPISDITDKKVKFHALETYVGNEVAKQLKKEMNMPPVFTIDHGLVEDLKNLINKGHQDEFTSLQGIPTQLRAALEEQLANENKEKYAALAKTLISLLRASDTKRDALIEEVRNLRAREKQALAQLNRLKDATELAKTQNNYLLLVSELDPSLVNKGILTPSELFVSTLPKNTAAKKPVAKTTVKK